MSPIVEHPDVRRKLLHHEGAHRRGAGHLPHHRRGARPRAARDGSGRAKAAHERASLLTPVAKAFSTDIGVEVASIGVQVHGGMGFIEETGAAQHLRDARILPIYEGTNGIQAIDLVTRKLPLSGGTTVRARIAAMRATAVRLVKEGTPAFGQTAPRLRAAIESLDRATSCAPEGACRQRAARRRSPARRRICASSRSRKAALPSPTARSRPRR